MTFSSSTRSPGPSPHFGAGCEAPVWRGQPPKTPCASFGRLCASLGLALLVQVAFPGCETPAPAGLQPEQPPFKREKLGLWGRFVQVESLQPTLSWTPFPESLQGGEELTDRLEGIRELGYELRVWHTENGFSGRLVYSRTDLREPRHQLEEPLEPSERYLWSVRASFLLDGRAQVSEWGLSSPYLRSYTLPNPACFRFRTPPLSENEQSP